MDFKDHFSAQAAAYARYRPAYPASLFDFLASCCRDHGLAWDCGTGNGQAALGLALHFTRVVATDASATQVAHATPDPNVHYAVAPAEQAPLEAHTADLVTVAQAVHWFDLDGFYAEVGRVLKPGGVVALWTYGLFRVAPEVDAVVDRYYHDVVGPYWPPERQLVDDAYRTLPFPFAELTPPVLTLEAEWDFDMLFGYLGTWSAYQRYRQQQGADPRARIREALAAAWGTAGQRQLRWPLYLRVGRTPG
jgi:SAM-dependent methyltransferase